MDVPQEVQVAIFLKEFKKIMTEGRGLDIVNRQENLASLLGLGLTKKNAEHEILSLSVSDYCSGPDPDQDRKGNIWVLERTLGRAKSILNSKSRK